MSSLWTLGLFSFLVGPASLDLAELGGSVVAEHVAAPLPSPLPITVRLYDGAIPVATAQADLFGRYALAAPPGDYWLQINVGADEARVERVLLRAGSWRRDFDVEVGFAAEPPSAIAGFMSARPDG